MRRGRGGGGEGEGEIVEAREIEGERKGGRKEERL